MKNYIRLLLFFRKFADTLFILCRLDILKQSRKFSASAPFCFVYYMTFFRLFSPGQLFIQQGLYFKGQTEKIDKSLGVLVAVDVVSTEGSQIFQIE